MALTPPIALRYRNAIVGVRPPEGDAVGGAGRDRTGDPLVANQVLSQLSYSPLFAMGPLDAATANTGQLSLESGGPKWIRTTDLTVISRALYQLSYRPVGSTEADSTSWGCIDEFQKTDRPPGGGPGGSLKTR